MLIGALLISFAMSPATGSTPPCIPRTIVSEPDHVAAGITLARLTYSDQMNRAVVDHTMTHGVGPAYRVDPNLSALDADHPGIIDAMLAAMQPELERGRTAALPRLWAEMGAAYAARLDADELRAATEFRQGPVGRRLADYQVRLILATARNGAPATDGGSLPRQSDADLAAIAAFHRSAAGCSLLAMQAEIEAINATWNERPDPATDARIQTAIERVMKRFWEGGGRR